MWEHVRRFLVWATAHAPSWCFSLFRDGCGPAGVWSSLYTMGSEVSRKTSGTCAPGGQICGAPVEKPPIDARWAVSSVVQFGSNRRDVRPLRWAWRSCGVEAMKHGVEPPTFPPSQIMSRHLLLAAQQPRKPDGAMAGSVSVDDMNFGYPNPEMPRCCEVVFPGSDFGGNGDEQHFCCHRSALAQAGPIPRSRRLARDPTQVSNITRATYHNMGDDDDLHDAASFVGDRMCGQHGYDIEEFITRYRASLECLPDVDREPLYDDIPFLLAL